MIEVAEHRMSLAEKKRFLREYNKAHPKQMPSGWWIAPGLLVAVLVVVALVAL